MKPALVLCALSLAACAGRQPTAAEERRLVDERSPYAFHRAMTYTLLRTGQYQKALPHARRLPLLRDDDAEAFYLLGRTYAGLELNEAAVEMLERSHRLRPRFLPAIMMLGVVADATADHQRAQVYHRRALGLATDNPVLLNNLGFSQYLAGDLRGAIASYRRALRYDTGSRRLHNNLGFAVGRLGQLDQAEKHFRLANSPAEALNNLGLVCEARGELDRARDYFQAAVAADPELGLARENLERVVAALPAAVVSDAALPAPVPAEGAVR